MYEDLPNHNKIELRTFVEVALRQGNELSVEDADGQWSEPSRVYADIMELVGEMDFDMVSLHRNGERVGWFMLVYGNGSGELISDYTVTPACQSVYDAWAEKVGVE
jgi:hypothetical protein